MSCLSVLSGAAGATPVSTRKVPEMGMVVIQATDEGQVVVSRKDGNDDVFKKPLPRGPGARTALKQKALDEDTYTSAIQTIIERDYFPELPYLRAKQAYEDAVSSRDPVRIREAEAHLKKCAQTPLGTSIATPGRFSTGRASLSATPRPGAAAEGEWGRSPAPATPGRGAGIAPSVVNADDEEDQSAQDQEVERVTKKRSLDEFVRKYTSEDNQSASQVMLKDSLTMEERRRWVYEQAAEHNMRQQLLLTNGPRQQDATLNLTMSTNYNPDDSLMSFVPATEFKRPEPPEVARRPQKVVNIGGTRVGKAFTLNLAAKGEQAAKAAAATPMRDGEVPASPRVGGFNFLLTPSPAPGVDDAPQFTWGSVDGTPLILPEDDMPSFQPFRVQGATSKEQAAEKLHRKKVEKSALAARSASSKHTPSRRGAPGTPQFSPAARALAAKLGKQAGDSTPLGNSLRASYRGTPSRTPARTPSRTPGPATPRGGAPLGASVPGTPRLSTPRAGTPPGQADAQLVREDTARELGRGMESEMRERLLRERLLAAGTGHARKDVTDGLLEI